MSADRFETKKSLGQHFLTSPIVPGWMCDAVPLAVGETVLEIGPGTGVLTKELLARGVQVIALEADQRAIDVLKEQFAAQLSDGTLTVHHLDVRDLDLTTIPELTDHSYTVVANIPYYLSGHLFRSFLESPVQPRHLVFLVQKEVAKRGTSSHAKGDKESLLSLSFQAYGTPTYVKTVTRGHFAPPPKVDSAIIAVTDIHRDRFTTLDEAFFFTVLHLGFGQKRKQLLGNLAGHYDRATVTNIFSTLGIGETVRAEDLPLETWLKLARALYPHANQ